MGSADNLPLVIFPLVLVIIYLVYLLVRPLPEPKPRAETDKPHMRDNRGAQHLNYSIGAVVLVIVCAVIVVNLPSPGDFTDISGYFPRAINMDLLIFICLVVGIPLYFFYRKGKKINDAKALALTPEHPFKVKVTIAPLEKSSFGLDVVRGRKLTHTLEIDVTISQKDWKRIKDAGVYDASLFKYPDTTSTHSGAMTDFPVSHLESGRKKYAGFYNIADAEIAKETLIENLYNLKDTISLHKEGKRSEALEI